METTTALPFTRRRRYAPRQRRRRLSSSSKHGVMEEMQKWGGPIAIVVGVLWLLAQLLMHDTLSDSNIKTTQRRMDDRRLHAVHTITDMASQQHLPRQYLSQNDDGGDDKRKVVEDDGRVKQASQASSADERWKTTKVSKKTRRVVESLCVPMPSVPEIPYNIFDCPKTDPPPDYPYHWPMRKILTDWNPSNTDIPAQIHQSLCVFDWDEDYDAIVAYRQAEVPFIVVNQPDLMKASERWMTGQKQLQQDFSDNINSDEPSYLEKMIGSRPQPVEYSKTNSFLYWKTHQRMKLDPDYEPPTQNVKLSYREWYDEALKLEQQANATSQASHEHWYFRLNAKGDRDGRPDSDSINDYLYDELPIFDPLQPEGHANNVFMVSPDEARGINCRFGMRGVMAATHYDSQRNWVVLMGGQRRYVISHPRECPNLHLYPKGHPSGRHSSVDWSNLEDPSILEHAQGTEVILQAAHALYIPSYVFHFIVSLNINYQCNARSGRCHEYAEYIRDCGFDV